MSAFNDRRSVLTRRSLLGAGMALGAAGLGLWPDARLLAQQVGDFL